MIYRSKKTGSTWDEFGGETVKHNTEISIYYFIGFVGLNHSSWPQVKKGKMG